MQQNNVLKEKPTKDDAVNKVNYIKAEQLTFDTYYFKPAQILKYHRHNIADQIFIVQEGEGEYYLDDEKQEEVIKIAVGSVFLAPKGVWHKVVNTGSGILVASQTTHSPSDLEWRPE